MAFAAPPPLSRQLVDLLRALFPSSMRGRPILRAGVGSAATDRPLSVGAILAPALVQELRFDPVDELRLSACTWDPSGREALDLGAVFVEIVLEETFDPARRRLVIRPETFAAATQGLAGLAAPMSFILDGGSNLIAAWLVAPVALDDPQMAVRVNRLQEGLARALGGRTDDVPRMLSSNVSRGARPTEPAWSPTRAALLLPGGRNKARSDEGASVVLVPFDLSHRFALTDLERVIAKRKGKK